MASERQSVERYELVSHLATGGMAEVFRARAYGPHGFEKSLAIKRILPRLSESDEFVERFIHEAKLAATLNHANVVHVLDFGRSEDGLYIAMEYVEGSDLSDVLKSRPDGLPLSVAIHIALEVCKGLDFAHTVGVVHRDVSPSNILLSVAGEVKVADFGVARAPDPVSGDPGRIVGKWPYMSPEQTRGAAIDARSDQFSLGVVLYELFTGECPTRGADIDETLARIREGQFSPPSERNDALPTSLDLVVLRCLERNAVDRYPSVEAVLEAIASLAYELHIVPTPRETASLVRELVREPSVGDATIETVPNNARSRLVGRSLVRKGRDKEGVSIWRVGPLQERRRRWWPWALLAVAIAASLITWRFVSTKQAGLDASAMTPAVENALAEIDAGTQSKPDAADAAPRAAVLVVTSRPPSAEVWLDGTRLGVTPFRGPVTRLGPSTLELKLEAHARKSTTVDLVAGETITIDERLTPQPRHGRISINSTPWAHVYFRGKRVATTPELKLRLPHGRHRLRLENPTLGVEEWVTITVPATSPYAFTLSAKSP